MTQDLGLDYITNFSSGWNFSLVSPGFWNKFSWNQIGDYKENDPTRAAIQLELKILSRFAKPGYDFQPGQTGCWNLKKSHIIETEFQPGPKNRKKDDCRYEVEAVSVE